MVNILRPLSMILLAFTPLVMRIIRSEANKLEHTKKSLHPLTAILLTFLLAGFCVGSAQAQFTPTLYRALNLNGPATTIDGNSWQSSNGAANFNYTTNGWPFEAQSVTLIPSTDANRATMIRSSIWGNPLNLNFTSVPNGSYDVYIYTWEDNSPTTFSISLEGTQILAAHNSGSAGSWSKLGPFRAYITDGSINLTLAGGDAAASGIEIWTAPGPPPVLSNPLSDQVATASQNFNFTVPSNSFTDPDAGTVLSYSATLANGSALPSWLTFNSTTRTFSGTPASGDAAALNVKVTASDNTGGSANDVFLLTINTGVYTLHRAVNLNGSSLNIDGNTWQASTGAANFSITNNGTLNEQGIPLNPPTDANRSTMIRSGVWGSLNLAMSSVPAGNYAIWVYVWEDNAPATFSFTLEGTSAVSNYNSGTMGTWAKLGPFLRTISDGTLNLAVNGGEAILSGIEVYTVNSLPVVANPVPDQTATASQVFSYTIPANTFSDPDVGTTLTYAASLSDGNPLPSWLTFTPGTRIFSGTPASGDAGVLNIRVTASDGGGGTVNDIFQLTINQPVFTPALYRALNLNGAALTIDGNSWESSLTAQNFNYSQTGGGAFANQSVTLVPATDANRATMIRSSVWGNAVNVNVTSVPNGSYDVYLYVWEDNFPENFSVSVEGAIVVPNHNSGSAGTWNKLGPFRINITDGAINLSANGGHAGLSGLEIWTAPNPPVVSNPIADQLAVVGESFNFTVPSNTFTDPDAGTTLSYSATLANGSALPSWLTLNASTRTFSGTPSSANAAAINVKVTATDGDGGSANDIFLLTINTGLYTLYRAINLNGSSLTIDGNTWQASAGASNLSITNNSTLNEQGIPLNPPTDANRSTMIRSGVWGSLNLSMSSMPAGNYAIWVYVWEDNAPITYSFTLEGTSAVSNYNSGSIGTWAKLGPFLRTISDGTLNLAVDGGEAILSGIEVYSVNGSTVPVTGVSVSPTTLALAPGQTGQLSKTISPANATNQNVSWSSSNTAVATVDNNGVVTAVASGTANVTATTVSGSFTSSATVTVSIPVTGVSVSPTTLSLAPGQTGQLSKTISPANATNQNVTWSSSNTAIATVDNNGLVTAVASGTANITATTVFGSFTSSATVTVSIPVTGVSVSPTTLSLTPGQTGQLAKTISPANATNQNVTWSSGNTAVATVDTNGLVTAVASGTTTITATTVSGSFTSSATVTVSVPVTGVSVSPTTLSLTPGQTGQLTKTISPANATNQNVTWSSNNTAIATVDNNGLVTALAAGTATITATSVSNTSVTGTSALTVNVGSSGLSPLIELKLNENSGTSVGNTGTLASTFTRTTTTPAWSTNVPASVGGSGSVDFATTTGNFVVESGSVIDGLKNLTSFTITGWVNCRNNTVGSGGNRIVSWINNGGDGADLVYRNDGSLQLGVDAWPDASPAFSSANKITTNASAPSGNWVFFAVTYQSSNSTVQFYFGNNATDATLDVTRTYARGAVGSNIGRLSVGHFNSASRAGGLDRMFKGLIDEIQIHSTVLTPSQVVSVQRSTPSTISVTGVGVSPSTLTLTPSQTGQLTKNIIPSNATNQNVSWSSNNPGVATVSTTGLVTAVAAGSATITATTVSGGFTATASVTVGVPVTGISVSPTVLNLQPGQIVLVTKNIAPANATNQSVIWSSSNTSIATVDANGDVMAVSAGVATITATTNDGGFTAQVSVTVTYPTGEVPDNLEIAALKEFYFSLDGPNWVGTNWPSTEQGWSNIHNVEQMHEWTGISLTNGDITELMLRGKRLRGSSIPYSIGNLANLEGIDVSGSGTSDGSQISSINNLNQLVNLKYLAAHSISLGMMPNLGTLQQLISLDLTSNPSIEKGTVPSWLQNLENLETLSLGQTNLTGEIPEWLGEINSLTTLGLGANELSGELPQSLQNVNRIFLGNNNFSGNLPNWIFTGDIIQLDFQGNNFSGPIPEPTSPHSVLTMTLANNQLSGELPKSANFWSPFSFVLLQGNQFSGEVPSTLATLFPGHLDLSNNRLTSINSNFWTQFTTAIPGSLILENNYLSLQTLTPAASISQYIDVYYSPQREVPVPSTVSVIVGSPLTLSGGFGETTWENIQGSSWVPTSPVIAQAQFEHSGKYRRTSVTTTPITLTVLSDDITVYVTEPVDNSPVERRYNGLITAMRWRTDEVYETADEEFTGMYLYRYDDKYQITDGRFADDINGTAFSITPSYRLTGMVYDPNGNIKTLKRFDENGVRQNDFLYHYEDEDTDPKYNNKLKKVDGYVNAYEYNKLGQMVGEDKVEGKDQYVDYDVTGKVTKIYDKPAKTVNDLIMENLYDDRGFRLAKINYETQRTTWYIRDASGNVISIYEHVGLPGGILEPLEWSTLTNIQASASGNYLLTSGSSNGEGISSTRLASFEEGYLEYTIEDLQMAKKFGLYREFDSRRFGFEFDDVSNTVTIPNSSATVSYEVGDVLKVAKEEHGNVVMYKNNTRIMGFSAGVANSYRVYIELDEPNAKFSNLKFKKTKGLNQTEVPIYGSGKLGTYYPVQDASTNYEITDHLGNVRALLRENVNTYTATMEDNGEPDESNPRYEELAYFQNIEETVVTDSRMNHTETTPGGEPNKAAYLFWNDTQGTLMEEKSIGPAIALRVHAGDALNVETWSRFERKTDYTHDFGLVAMSALLGNTFGASGGFEGFTLNQTATNLEGALTAGAFPDDGGDDTRPFAYLNYIVYDEEMVYQSSGWRRVSDDAGFYPEEIGLEGKDPVIVKFDDPITIEQSGYIYVWVSNQSKETRVWFDDLKVTFTQNIVVQATDYGVWGDVIREQKTDESIYRFGYQGQFAEKDEETGWNHFELREYDPVVGRWTSKDPAGQYHSPYVGMGNNPVSGVDPDGAWLFGLFGSTSEQRQAARAIRDSHEGAEINNFFSKNISVTYQSTDLQINEDFLSPGATLFSPVVTSRTVEFDRDGYVKGGFESPIDLSPIYFGPENLIAPAYGLLTLPLVPKSMIMQNSSRATSVLSYSLGKVWTQKINWFGQRKLYTHTLNGVPRFTTQWGRYIGRWGTRIGPWGWVITGVDLYYQGLGSMYKARRESGMQYLDFPGL